MGQKMTASQKKRATQVQQRPGTPTVTLTWHACKKNIYTRYVNSTMSALGLVLFQISASQRVNTKTSGISDWVAQLLGLPYTEKVARFLND